MLAGQAAGLSEVRRRAAPQRAQPLHQRARTASVRREQARRSALLDRPMLKAPATIREAQETQLSRLIPPAQTPLERPILRDQRPAAEARQSVRRRSERRAILQAERRAVASTVL